MKVLCLGNNTEQTDQITRGLANAAQEICYGLISNLETSTVDFSAPGFYHSSVFDLNYGQLIDIGQQFDQVVILDQTIESYNHPDSFYKTIRVGNQLAEVVKVVWQNDEMPKSINVFENLVKTNPSFCIFPFIELLANNGHTTVCCRSSTPITKISSLTDYSNDPHYQSIRSKMLDGIKIPEHCSECYRDEELNIVSARQQETVEWANRLGLRSIDDLKNIQQPVYYEVRASNICNLKCRTCNPGSSELINKEYTKLGLVPELVKFEYSNFNIVNLDHVMKLYVAGGEPTAMPDFYSFVDRCIDENRIFDFTVNTNAVKISNVFKRQLRKMPHMQFIVSIDGFKELNDYIRWPSNWDKITSNVNYLKDNKHTISFNTTVSMYNVAELSPLLRYFDQNFPGTLVHLNIATGISSPWNFPDASLVLEDLKEVTNLNCFKDSWLLSSCINGIINYFQQPKIDLTELNEFKKFNQLLDAHRGVDMQRYAPKLWSALKGNK